MLDSADTIAAFAGEMSEFLKTSELTETRAFVRSFVKEVQVRPGKATIIYTIPMPEDSPIGGADAAEIALNGGVMNTVHSGGLHRHEHDGWPRRSGAILQWSRGSRVVNQGGKYALNWTRLSCHRFVANRVRLSLFVLAYNLGNFFRRLCLPKAARHWSLRACRSS